MSNVSRIISGAGLMLIGIAYILQITGVLSFDIKIASAYLLLFYGLVFVSANLGKNHRGILFAGAVIFIAGVVMFVINNYEILNPVKILLPSILFSVATGFLMLYVDDSKEKMFLIAAVILYVISLLLIKLMDFFFIINYANRISFVILQLWPVFLLLAGIGLLVNRKKN